MPVAMLRLKEVADMETMVDQKREVDHGKRGNNVDEYRTAVKSLIESEVKNVIDEEMRKAAQELLDEQRKAIRQMVEEHRVAIREAVEEERKAIKGRVDALKQSVLEVSLG